MTNIRESLRSRAVGIVPAGAVASLLSMVALALRGRAEAGSAAPPVNPIRRYMKKPSVAGTRRRRLPPSAPARPGSRRWPP